MADEQWLKDAKERIDSEVDLQIWNLEQLAEKECLDVAWVIETFANKFAYRVNEENKNR